MYIIIISPLEFPLGNGNPGWHDVLENSFHMFPRIDYLQGEVGEICSLYGEEIYGNMME